MTEAEWLACTEPGPMLAFLQGRASDRKLRLLACGCCRALWDVMFPDSRAAVEAAERYADGRADRAALDRARDAAEGAADGDRWLGGDQGAAAAFPACYAAGAPYRVVRPGGAVNERTTWDLMCFAVDYAVQAAATPVRTEPVALDGRGACRLVRCCLGPLPFRPVAADPRWLTSAVVPLSQAIYAERAFDRLPILADALEDAGCDDAEVLAHCRGDGPHVRGCWVVDLLLGKE